MPFSIDNTTSSANFVQFGNGLYVSGWLYVSNNSVDVFLEHSPGGGSSPFEQGPILTLPPSQYQLYGSAHDPIRSLNIRSTVAANPAQFVGVLNEAGTAGIIGGSPITTTLSAGGVVTGTGGMITGIIPALGTTPTAGTGFTYTHVNASGIYKFTFNTAYAATPVIVCTMTASNPSLAPNISVASGAGFTVNWQQDGGAFADTAFNFLVSPVS